MSSRPARRAGRVTTYAARIRPCAKPPRPRWATIGRCRCCRSAEWPPPHRAQSETRLFQRLHPVFDHQAGCCARCCRGRARRSGDESLVRWLLVHDDHRGPGDFEQRLLQSISASDWASSGSSAMRTATALGKRRAGIWRENNSASFPAEEHSYGIGRMSTFGDGILGQPVATGRLRVGNLQRRTTLLPATIAQSCWQARFPASFEAGSPTQRTGANRRARYVRSSPPRNGPEGAQRPARRCGARRERVAERIRGRRTRVGLVCFLQ